MTQEHTAVTPTIFRAYDIRGVVADALTAETVKKIGQAIASEVRRRGGNTVVIGRDGRLSGAMLSDALAEGLMAAGCDVIDVGQVPTPVLYFAIQHLGAGSGVAVTGSHNPPEYNGLKIVAEQETLSGPDIQDLYRRIIESDLESGEGKRQFMSVDDDYLQRIVSDVKMSRPMKVIADCGNGVAGELLPKLLKQMGCEVTELFCEIDGNFPNHHPDPSQPENLQDLIQAVQSSDADLGLAFDGDGDRLGVVDRNGKVIWPDRQLMLFVADILSRNPAGKIIFDVKCTYNLPDVIRSHGGEPIMWKTGHSFIKAKLRESGALLAGEMSGHIFFKERWYGFDDGLYAAARLLEVLSKSAESPTEIFAALPDTVNTPELKITLNEGEHYQFMERMQAEAEFPTASINTIDGLRVDFEKGWGLVRASNTTPCLVLRFEAQTEEDMAAIQEQFRQQMLKVDSGMRLPF
jgi:phosphomannomutase / phosphoglucomutase